MIFANLYWRKIWVEMHGFGQHFFPYNFTNNVNEIVVFIGLATCKETDLLLNKWPFKLFCKYSKWGNVYLMNLCIPSIFDFESHTVYFISGWWAGLLARHWIGALSGIWFARSWKVSLPLASSIDQQSRSILPGMKLISCSKCRKLNSWISDLYLTIWEFWGLLLFSFYWRTETRNIPKLMFHILH